MSSQTIQTVSWDEVVKRDLLHVGDVIGVQWKDPDWISRQIIAYQRSFDDLRDKELARISHVALVTSGRALEAVEMWQPHGRIITLDQVYGSGCVLHVHRHQWDNPEDRFRMVIRAAFDANVTYSFLGIGHFLFRFVRPIKTHQFCSQLVVRSARKYGIVVCRGQEDWEVTPAELCDDGSFAPALRIDTDLREVS